MGHWDQVEAQGMGIEHQHREWGSSNKLGNRIALDMVDKDQVATKGMKII